MKYKHTPTKKQQAALLERVRSLNPEKSFVGRVDEYTGYFVIETVQTDYPGMVGPLYWRYGEYTKSMAESILNY